MVSEARVPWHQSFALWEIYFAVVAVSVGAAILAQEDARRPEAVAALAALTAWYLAYGRRLAAVDDRTMRGVVFQGGVLLLYAVGVVFVDVFSFVLFALCPLAFMTLSVPRAAVAVVALNALLPVRQLIAGVDPGDVLRGPVPIAVVVVVFSVIVGIWLEGVQRQNDERAVLIAELEASRAEVARLCHEAGVNAERQRLAGDIHDTIAQGLSSVLMLMQAADADLDHDPGRSAGTWRWRPTPPATTWPRRGRWSVRSPRPPSTTRRWPEALRRLVDRFGRRPAWSRSSRPSDGPPLPKAVEVVLLRAAQESLTNVRKHARAGTVAVRLD